MSWDPMECSWQDFSSRLKATWVELTEEDLAVIRGKLDLLAGEVQEHSSHIMEREKRHRDGVESPLRNGPATAAMYFTAVGHRLRNRDRALRAISTIEGPRT